MLGGGLSLCLASLKNCEAVDLAIEGSIMHWEFGAPMS